MTDMDREHPTETGEDIEPWLVRAKAGEREALDGMMELLYKEIRRMAAGMLKGEPDGISLQATDLANVVYIRLARSQGLTFENRAYFMSLASTVMRHVLADHAKARRSDKRGGGFRPLPLDQALAVAVDRSIDVEMLHEALGELEALNVRHARLLEHRLFAGLSVEESASALGVSPTTVKREFAVATKWLNRRLRGQADGS